MVVGKKLPDLLDDFGHLAKKVTDIKLRRGRFLIRADLLNDSLPFLQKVFSQVIITQCEHRWNINAFDYMAISPLFNQCPESDVSSDYIFFEDKLGDLLCEPVKNRFVTLFIEKLRKQSDHREPTPQNEPSSGY